MSGLIRLQARPKLRAPVLLAAWPGVGNVATIVATYLLRKLDFKVLGYIEPSYFFDPIGVSVRDGVVESPQFPQSNFYYWKNKHCENDLILFIGDDQPPAKAYELAHSVLDLATRFQVSRIYTCAAALTRIHHTEPPRVWGVATSQEVVKSLAQYDLGQASNVQIAGLNGLLLGVAKERDIEAVCLLGEVPLYATRIQNPIAALAVLKALVRVLHIEVDMDELAGLAVETGERMKEMAAQAMGEYIDFFTEPIWERGEGEDEEED
ncbi:MAG: PAC2 family protein [Chloroflexi bacterium]|nr:PAC2 family protein [Chloroflexota bacterium]